MVNRKDSFSIKKLVNYSLYRSIRDRKFDGTDRIPELISLRTTLVHIIIAPNKNGFKAARQENRVQVVNMVFDMPGGIPDHFDHWCYSPHFICRPK